MTLLTLSSRRRAALAAVAALVFGLSAAIPAEAVGARGFDDGGATAPRLRPLHRASPRARAPRGRRLAFRTRHRRARFAVAEPRPRFGVAGVPAGYASDESAYNVGAEGMEFDTGAFYGCLHNVLTAGGYRPVATCR